MDPRGAALPFEDDRPDAEEGDGDRIEPGGNAMISMPVSIVAAIFGAAERLTDEPWCSVFHHLTEK